MRIAITGATGNIGTALVRRLGSRHELVGLARRLPEAGGSDNDTGVRWATVDLTHDGCRNTLRWAFRDVDAVVHLAWGFQPSHDPGYLEELGVGGTRRVLQAAVAVGVPHLVHMSSVGAYSAKVDDRPVDETWPTDGIAPSPYSRHKVAAERLLDAHEAGGDPPRVTRLRPGIVGQRAAASAMLRYALPGFLPARAIRASPVLPLARGIAISMVHADDVAEAIELVVVGSASGAFNLAAADPVRPPDIGAALGARVVYVPGGALRAAAAASWRVHLQQVDPGWVDLALSVPVLDSTKARTELGWRPSKDADEVLRETVRGMRDAAAAGTPVLRPRTVLGRAHDLLRQGPISRRPRP
ncbi:MAG: NAD-dependent epimerase/dehydratase family protein [Actinomycetota bacterium]|nr:NAD-dependent epimerase/dehydratase family protein [Actinomycetota bacterium]